MARRMLTLVLMLATLLAALPAPAPVAAADCTVTSAADSSINSPAGSLRQKLNDPTCATIAFALPGTAPWTIALKRSLPTITRPLTITGPGVASLTVTGDNTFPLLPIDARATPGMAVAVSGLTLTKGYPAGYYGGNLRSWAANLALTDVALTGATAAAYFGGAGAAISGGTATLTRVTVGGNTAPGSATYQTGAGLYIDNANGDTAVTIADSTIVDNTATDFSGGGLAIVRASGTTGRALSVTLTNSTVGTADHPNAASIGSGGGIYNMGGTLTLNNSTVDGNTASGSGGGLYVIHGANTGDVTVTLTNSAVRGNKTTKGSGGGLYLYNDTLARTVTATLTNSTVSGNTASIGLGGGLYLFNDVNSGSSTATLTNSTVSDNIAYAFGGGLCVVNSANFGNAIAILANTIVSNNSSVSGGGLYVLNSADYGIATATLTNATVSTNTATVGGGLYVTSSNNGPSTATLRFSTVTGNIAKSYYNDNGNSGGLGTYQGTIRVLSSIVAGNLQGTANPAASDCGGPLTSQGRNLWGDYATCPNNAADGDRNLVTLNTSLTSVLNPTLAPNGGPTKTHALVPGSPAIDHGDNTACATTLPAGAGGTDQRGVPRSDGQCDVGAYEYAPGVSPAPSPTPSPSPGTSPAPSPSPAISPAPSPSPGTSPAPSPSPGTSPGPSPAASPVPVTVPPPPADQGTVTVQQSGNQVVITATPAVGQLFLGWLLNGGAGGASVSAQATTPVASWANPWTFTPTTSATVTAVFGPAPAFTDVPATDPAYTAITNLAARGIINGCFTDPVAQTKDFCPADSTLRHQMAALIARAMPGWADETGLPTFGDNTDDTELMTRVATLQRHNVVRGYQDAVCQERGLPAGVPCYGPLDTVKYGQVMLFIARAMVQHNYWVLQPDDRILFPDQNGAATADPNSDQQTLDHRAVVTYLHYAGTPPDVADSHAPFALASGQGWGDATPRAWFARAFWQALDSYFGR